VKQPAFSFWPPYDPVLYVVHPVAPELENKLLNLREEYSLPGHDRPA
jgi:hypothetical protein